MLYIMWYLSIYLPTFEALNNLNLLLQGKNTNRIKDYDAIYAVTAKLGLWYRQVLKG